MQPAARSSCRTGCKGQMPVEEDEMGNGPEMLAMLDNPQTFAFLIPIVAIVVWGATEIVKTIMHHQERAQMIARGMDPDAPHRKPEAK